MKKQTQTGFTLLELLIVISIIGILAGITIISYPGIVKKAKLANAIKFSDNVRGSLQPDMVAWWKFDETAGTIAHDTWWNELHGTVNGAIWVEGINRNALSFDGVDDYVSVPHDDFLNPSFVTISAWVYPITYGTYYPYVIKKYNNYLIRFYAKTGRVQNYTYIDGAWRACTSPSTIIAPLNQWSYLTHTYDGLKGKLYINGVLACSFNYAGTINTSGTGILTIGSYYTTTVSTNYRFNGLIDDVQIYSAALPLSMIEQLYAQGLKTHQNLAKK